MNINVERFLALTAMLAAPLVAAPGCIINGSDDDSTSASNSNTNAETGNETGDSTGNTSAPTTTQSDSTVGESTVGDTTIADSTVGDTTAGDSTAGDTGADLGNCCVPDDHGAGCEVTDVQDCVCGEDALCCDEVWDMICVSEVNQLGCGECALPAMVWDCYCTADCDGTSADSGPFQVCGADDTEAGTNGQMACEADPAMMGCTALSCSDCFCSTAEIPEIEC